MMYLKYPANNLTYIYSQSTPYAGALDAWIEGKVEEYRDSIEVVPSYGYAFQKIKKVVLPQCSIVNTLAFAYCDNLEEIKMLKCNNIDNYAFMSCYSLSALYLLNSNVCSMGTAIFMSTPILLSSYLGYYGSIYVPESLVNTYKNNVQWSYYADRIAAYGGDSQ